MLLNITSKFAATLDNAFLDDKQTKSIWYGKKSSLPLDHISTLVKQSISAGKEWKGTHSEEKKKKLFNLFTLLFMY